MSFPPSPLLLPFMGLLDTFVSQTLGLAKLPPFLPTLLLSFLAFTLVHLLFAPLLSQRWFPTAYTSKSRTARNNWAIHVVSQVHVLIIIPMALWCVFSEVPGRGDTHADRAFGWDDHAGWVHAVACGYFLWDTLDAIVNFVDLGFVVHGLVCLFIFTFSYHPFLQYYGTRCLLWEASTFFLNIHWFLDKTNHTGSTFQLVNGICLLFTFFSVRLVYGGFISVNFFITFFTLRKEISLFYAIVYGLGNVILQILNWIWFAKMIKALQKRFRAPDEDQAKLIDNDELAEGLPT